jgi:hypothetical protein
MRAFFAVMLFTVGIILLLKFGTPVVEVDQSRSAAPKVLADSDIPVPVLNSELLLKTVIYFCQVNFHPESCIAYVHQCGPPCTRWLRSKDKSRIIASFQSLREQKGLPPIDPRLFKHFDD